MKIRICPICGSGDIAPIWGEQWDGEVSLCFDCEREIMPLITPQEDKHG